MKYLAIPILMLLFFPAGSIFAETPGTMARDAEQAYQGGDYAQAMEKWEALVALGYLNGPILNNLGTAAWQSGQAGRGRWYYLRGLSLDPRNGALRNNLNFVDEKLGLTKPEPADGPWRFLAGLPFWKFAPSFFELLRGAALWSVFFFGILWIKKWKGNPAGKWFRWGFGIPMVLLAGMVLWQTRRLYFNDEAVVLTADAALLGAPSLEAGTGQALPEGSMVRVLKGQGEFRLLKIPSGTPSWMKADQLGPLRLK